MLKKSVFDQNRNVIFKNASIGAIIGGILGIVASSWIQFGSLSIPIMITFLTESTLDKMITGPIIGIIIGGTIGYLMTAYIPQDNAAEDDFEIHRSDIVPKQHINNTDNTSILQLREEQLDIYKKWIKTGEVSVHKEVYTKEKNITVPVICEELVIEKKVLDGETSEDSKESTDTIRIPISEERVDVTKHKVILEDVNIYKQQFQETKHIEEILKKEKLNIKTTGDLNVTDKDSKS